MWFKALRKLRASEGKAWEWTNICKSYWRVILSYDLSPTLTNEGLCSKGWGCLSDVCFKG